MHKTMTRDAAWTLLTTYTKTPALQTHALAVEAAMRHFAVLNGEDPEDWGVVGLLHDLDYEMYPDLHCAKGAELMRTAGVDEFYIHAMQSHGYGLCSDVAPESALEKTLYTIDELTGLINAACLMRPSKSILDVELKSIKKKFKTKSFAAGVDRAVVLKGCELLGMPLEEVMQHTIDGMKAEAEAIGLKGTL